MNPYHQIKTVHLLNYLFILFIKMGKKQQDQKQMDKVSNNRQNKKLKKTALRNSRVTIKQQNSLNKFNKIESTAQTFVKKMDKKNTIESTIFTQKPLQTCEWRSADSNCSSFNSVDGILCDQSLESRNQSQPQDQNQFICKLQQSINACTGLSVSPQHQNRCISDEFNKTIQFKGNQQENEEYNQEQNILI